MAQGAPKGNKFWMLRSKHGKDIIFSNPAVMWEAACEYFEWCVANPVQVQEIHSNKGEPKRMNVKKQRVFLMTGLCLHLGVNEKYFYNFKKAEACTEEFRQVIHMIEDTVRTQKHTMGYSGEAPANLVALDLEMKMRLDMKAENVNYNSVPVTKEEAREIAKALEEEY